MHQPNQIREPIHQQRKPNLNLQRTRYELEKQLENVDEYITGDQSFEERNLPVGEEEKTRRRELL